MHAGALHLRQNKRGISPVLGATMMVVTTVGMSASVFLMIGAFLPATTEDPTQVSFTNRGYQTAPASGYCCLNDSVLEVEMLRGARQEYADALTYEVLSADGSQILVRGDLPPLASDPGLRYLGVYHGSPDEPSVINVGYVDADTNGYVSLTDFLEIRGMSKEYHNAKFLVIAPSGQIASVELP